MPSGILTFKEELTRIKINTVYIFSNLYTSMSHGSNVMCLTAIKLVSAVLKILSMEKNIVQTTHFTAHNNKIPVNCLILLIGVLGSLGFASSAFAETRYEIQAGDSLSKIISKNYPNVARRSYAVIIQDIINNNPQAFNNKNANSLRLGKVLTLVDQDKIAGLKKNSVSVPVTPAVEESVEKEPSDTTTGVDKTTDTNAYY